MPILGLEPTRNEYKSRGREVPNEHQVLLAVLLHMFKYFVADATAYTGNFVRDG